MPNPEVFQLESDILKRRRKLAVWLPREYEENPDRDFPLLLVQDGQLVFTSRDEELPFGSWGLDTWLERLARDAVIDVPVVAAVYNSPHRMKEYFPVTDHFDRYERFLLEQLIPWLEENYRLRTGPENRTVMGSSMGGLASFALAANNPGVLGAAGCLSPWFEYDSNRYIHDVLRPMKVKPDIRVYMDSGIKDWRGLDDGHRGMLLARLELLRLGFEEGKDLDWTVDTWFPSDADLKDSPVKPEKRPVAKNNQHNDFQWNRRLGRPLRFLLGRDKKS